MRSKCQQETSGLIGRAHALGLEIYAWRWPATKPQPNSTTHYFATDEAAFVAEKLIPAGLDGYVVDPESDEAGTANDWNDASLAPLATSFSKTITAAAAGNSNFRFGLTSGRNYPSKSGKPHIPWGPFVSYSDVLLPQTYWRVLTKTGRKPANGGSPAKAIARGLPTWAAISQGKPIAPMAGELGSITEQEISAYGAELMRRGMNEAHFYIDGAGSSTSRLAAIKAL